MEAGRGQQDEPADARAPACPGGSDGVDQERGAPQAVAHCADAVGQLCHSTLPLWQPAAHTPDRPMSPVHPYRPRASHHSGPTMHPDMRSAAMQAVRQRCCPLQRLNSRQAPEHAVLACCHRGCLTDGRWVLPALSPGCAKAPLNSCPAHCCDCDGTLMCWTAAAAAAARVAGLHGRAQVHCAT